MTKQHHIAAERQNALAILNSMDADVGQSYYTLRPYQIDILIKEADRVRYQKPANANGSRGRYFYDRLQRQAARKG